MGNFGKIERRDEVEILKSNNFDMEEVIDIVDENNILVGKTEKKSIAHKKGLWHRAVHIWIYNKNNELIIQKRTQNKEYFPGFWDLSVGGHVGAGEKPIEAAIREIGEEIGINATENDLKFQFIIKEKNPYKQIINNEIIYVYGMKWDGDIKELRLQKEEVESIKFIKFYKLKVEIENNKKDFIPHGNYWFKMIDILETGKGF